MQKHILLNLVGASVLALLCACGTTETPKAEESKTAEEVKKEALANVPADQQQAAAVTAQAETPATAEAAAPAESAKVAVNQTEEEPVQGQTEEDKTAEQKA